MSSFSNHRAAQVCGFVAATGFATALLLVLIPFLADHPIGPVALLTLGALLLAVLPVAVTVFGRGRYLWAVLILTLATAFLWPFWFAALAVAGFGLRPSRR